MAELTGYSFSPGLQKRFTSAINGQSPLTPGQSQALQVLALRLPGFLGGNTPAPDALLRRPVGGLRPDLAVRAQVGAPSAPDQSTPDYSPAAPSAFRGLAGAFGGSPFQPQGTDQGLAGGGTGTPGLPNIDFTKEKPIPRDPGVLPGIAGPSPETGTPQPPPDLGGLMNSFFRNGSGGRFDGGDGGGGNRFI